MCVPAGRKAFNEQGLHVHKKLATQAPAGLELAVEKRERTFPASGNPLEELPLVLPTETLPYRVPVGMHDIDIRAGF